MNNYFFTADEHYAHKNIIKFCNRPFSTLEEMNETLIERHNSVVKDGDTVVHVGDFCFLSTYEQVNRFFLTRLNGKHILLKGSHDYFMRSSKNKDICQVWSSNIGDNFVVVSHYPFAIWPKSHYNSWHLHGHTHGRYSTKGKVLDVGVDTHSFYPYSWDEVMSIMSTKEDNINKVKD